MCVCLLYRKDLLISSATVIVSAREAIWLNTFSTVLFNVCSSVTVECCVLYPCCVCVFGIFSVLFDMSVISIMFVKILLAVSLLVGMVA